MKTWQFVLAAAAAFGILSFLGSRGLGPVIAVLFFGAVAALLVYRFLVRRKIQTKGIETSAVVTSIDREESTDSDGDIQVSYSYHVQYQNQAGELVDGTLQFMMQGRKKLQVGDWISIKYLPERQNTPVMTGRINTPEL